MIHFPFHDCLEIQKDVFSTIGWIIEHIYQNIYSLLFTIQHICLHWIEQKILMMQGIKNPTWSKLCHTKQIVSISWELMKFRYQMLVGLWLLWFCATKPFLWAWLEKLFRRAVLSIYDPMQANNQRTSMNCILASIFSF